MKTIILFFGILLLSIFLVSANVNHKMEIEEGRQIVESNVICNKLNDEQLESIGEYYMEKMHPGESHDLMHRMMGIKEETKEHKQFHVDLARVIYCGEENVFGSEGMMGGGMMNMMMGGNMMGYGMMGNFGYGLGYWNFLNALYVILLIGLIILVYFGVIKLWKNMQNKCSKK